MKSALVLWFISFAIIFTIKQSFAQELVLGDLKPIYKKCNDIPESKQSVKYESNSANGSSVRWTWRETPSGNCHWALSLPIDISTYIDGFLIISFIDESNKGANSPEVAILDGDGNRTPLLKLYQYKSEKQFKIPLTDFGLDNINVKKVKQLQLDSPWDHSEGHITIQSIKFVKP